MKTFGISKVLKKNPYLGCQEKKSLLGFLGIRLWETQIPVKFNSVGRGSQGLMSTVVSRLLKLCGENYN